MTDQAAILPGLSNHKYKIQIAKNEKEVDSALSLRYDIFNLELKRGFRFNYGRDTDEYDDQCHHLLIKLKATDEIVGTYRLQTWENAEAGMGFYSAKRFEMNQMPASVLKNAIEVGRACIREDHRSGRVLFLLWKGLAAYLQHFDKRYLFGSSALQTSDPGKALQLRQYLKENGFSNDECQVEARREYLINLRADISNEEIGIPPLFKNYLDVGAKVCGGPAIDIDANSAYFLTLLDVESISDRTRKMFFG
jgi:putative hemolysin